MQDCITGNLNIIIEAAIGMLLGVSLAAPPGPITSMIVNRAVKSIPKAFYIALGAMTADATLMFIVFILHGLIDLSRFYLYIYAIGAAFMFYFAYAILKEKTDEESSHGTYLKGLTVGIVNPAQIGWWLTAGLSFLNTFGYPVFYFLFVGITIWVLFLSYVINRGARAFGMKAESAIRMVSFLMLIVFGIYFLIRAVTLL